MYRVLVDKGGGSSPQSPPSGYATVFEIQFQEACPNDTFSIDQTTGVLSVIRIIDYSGQSGLEPVCVCRTQIQISKSISLPYKLSTAL